MRGLAREGKTPNLDINKITVVLKRKALEIPIAPSSGRITHDQDPIGMGGVGEHFVLLQKSS